jgi:hypothetical protein
MQLNHMAVATQNVDGIEAAWLPIKEVRKCTHEQDTRRRLQRDNSEQGYPFSGP